MAYSTTSTLIALHRTYWERKLKEPITNLDCSFTRHFRHIPALPAQWSGKDGLLLTPEMLEPDGLQQEPIPVENPIDPLAGQVAFNTLFPYPRVPWLVGVMGCGLLVSATAKTVWPVPALGRDWFTQPDLGFRPNRAWLEKLLEFVQFIADRFYPLDAIPAQDMVVRGPGDLCVNLMGSDTFYYNLYDHPREVKRLLGEITDWYIEWAKTQLNLIPMIDGGHVNQYGIWCPGSCIRFQEDYAINLSPQLLREFILPCSRQVTDAFDYSVIHTHSGDPHLAEIMLDLTSLSAIEVSLDPNGPPLEQLVPLWNRILEKKCLIIAGPVTPSELDFLRETLIPGGLWLDVEMIPEGEQQARWQWDQNGS